MKDLADVTKWFQDFITATDISRSLIERDRDYVDNKQWTAAEEAELKKRNQPVITVNRIKPKIEALIGIEIQQRTDIKAFPRNNPQDAETAEAATDALRYVADDGDFDYVKTQGARNLFVEGTVAGIVEVEPSAKGGFDVRPSHIPWDRFILDPRSCRLDGKDARFMGQAIWIEAEDAKAMFPSVDEGMFSNDNLGDTFDDKPKDMYISENRVRLIELYYISGGQWYHCIFTGMGFCIEPRISPYLDDEGVPCNPIELSSAYIDRDNNRYGAVRQMISIQDEINKRRSKAMHLLSVRQVIADEGAVDDVKQAKRELAKPDGWLVRNPGRNLEISNTADLAMGQFNLLAEAKSEIDAIGANASVLGKDDRVQSGRALQSRQQAGMAEVTPVLDMLRSWEKRMYRQMWARIKQFWTEEKWVRVTDDEKNIKFVALNRPILFKELLEKAGTPYDVMDPRANRVIGIENPIGELEIDIVL